jgi:hypothetical protein
MHSTACHDCDQIFTVRIKSGRSLRNYAVAAFRSDGDGRQEPHSLAAES